MNLSVSVVPGKYFSDISTKRAIKKILKKIEESSSSQIEVIVEYSEEKTEVFRMNFNSEVEKKEDFCKKLKRKLLACI